MGADPDICFSFIWVHIEVRLAGLYKAHCRASVWTAGHCQIVVASHTLSKGM